MAKLLGSWFHLNSFCFLQNGKDLKKSLEDLTASFPLKMYHLKRNGSSSNQDFFLRGSMFHLRGF